MSKSKSGLSVTMINSIIGIAIMFIIRMFPPVAPITETGMEVLGIFIGTLYLWTTVDPTWASIFSIFMIGFSSYSNMGGVIKEAFGNPTVVQMLFMMVFSGALVREKITPYIGRWFLTRKVSEGKPWLLTFVISLGCLLMAVFLGGPFAPIFLFWPVMYDIFQQLGYTNKETYPKLAVIMVVFGSMLGFPVPPYAGNPLALLTNYRTISNNTVELNDGMYFASTLIMGIVFLAITIIFLKYVIHPDVSKLKSLKIDDLKKNPLPPMSIHQKILAIAYVVYVLCMLIPSWFPTLPGMAFLKANSTGMAATFVAVLAAIQIAGKPVIDIQGTMKTNVAWSSFFLCTSAILIGSVLTAENTGITPFLNQLLSPLFTGMSTVTFIIFLMVVLCVLTNVCNSLVIGMILQPVILSYCTTTGINAAPIVSLSIFFVLSCAMETPAASPFAAMLFGNKEWLEAKDIYKYCGMIILLEFALVLVIGIPMMNLFMG